MSLEKKDVRLKISAEAHQRLVGTADFHEKDISEYASFLLERSIMGDAHMVTVYADRAARWGKSGNPGGERAAPAGLSGKRSFKSV